MRSPVEIEYAITSVEFTRDAAREQKNTGAEALAFAILDTLRWAKGETGTAFETFIEAAMQTEAVN